MFTVMSVLPDIHLILTVFLGVIVLTCWYSLSSLKILCSVFHACCIISPVLSYLSTIAICSVTYYDVIFLPVLPIFFFAFCFVLDSEVTFYSHNSVDES